MKKIQSILMLLMMFFGASFASHSQDQPSAGHNYIVLYIETVDGPDLQSLLKELRDCEGKVVSAQFVQPNSELYVTYTDAMRDDTIIQIVYKYFTKIKKVRGTNIVEYE